MCLTVHCVGVPFLLLTLRRLPSYTDILAQWPPAGRTADREIQVLDPEEVDPVVRSCFQWLSGKR